MTDEDQTVLSGVLDTGFPVVARTFSGLLLRQWSAIDYPPPCFRRSPKRFSGGLKTAASFYPPKKAPRIFQRGAECCPDCNTRQNEACPDRYIRDVAQRVRSHQIGGTGGQSHCLDCAKSKGFTWPLVAASDLPQRFGCGRVLPCKSLMIVEWVGVDLRGEFALRQRLLHLDIRRVALCYAFRVVCHSRIRIPIQGNEMQGGQMP